MTEAREQGAAVADEWEIQGSSYSKDYWDLFFEQMGKRRLVKAAMALLVLIYASAIYAPLIASDRPYVIEAVGYKAYESAHRNLKNATLGLSGLLRKTPEEFLAGRMEGSDQSYEEALASEEQAARRQVDAMKAALAAELHGPLDEFADVVGQAVRAATAGDREKAMELRTAMRDKEKEIRRDYVARQPPGEEEDGAPENGGTASGEEPQGVELQGQRGYPLFETISWGAAFFMILWAAVLLWPLWNRLVNRLLLGGDRDRIRRARIWKWVGVLGLSLGGAVAWGVLIGGEMTFASSRYKGDLTSGDLVATTVVLPPLPMGFGETRFDEKYRPPTWTRKSVIDEEGYYVHRREEMMEVGPGGVKQAVTPVAVLHGEPERNSAWRHPLGTDSAGRDMLVRLLWGGRVSLTVGLLSAALLALIGTFVGAVAGFFGGWVDLVLSRFIEIVLCFPAFFLILMAVAFTDPSFMDPIYMIVIVIALVRWTGVARLARGEFLKLREQEFVISARALGFSHLRTIFRHVLPNAMGPILVATAFAVAAGILTESAISFLGFGIQPPDASWGSLVNESKSAEHWWIQVFPGLMIFLTVTCYNLVGDGIRDALDPKMKT